MHDSDKLHLQRVWPQPNFTIGDLKNAIPKHCFHRSFWVSTKHLLGDLATILCTFIAMNYLNTLLWDNSFYMWLLCWIIYVPYQGVNMMAAWVLAHECGHGALYNQPWLNDVVGYLIHTALFVPYFPWKYTHAVHHRYTNNVDKDQVWVPDIAKDNEKEKTQLLEEAKITKRNIVRILLVSILGWPMYLYTNYGAAKTKEPNNHFTYCKMFHSKPKWTVLLSTYGLVAWAATLLVIAYYVGLFKLIGLYVLPYGVVNFFLVTITFLQHKDEKVPHLTDHSYEWLRAALCTVDRSMGVYLDTKLHLIHVTHVAHHLFSYIPFYHSTEVTEAIKPILGPYYIKDERNYWYCLWNHYKYWGTIENNNTAIHYWFLGTS